MNMQLELFRRELFSSAPISSRKTLLLLGKPSKKKKHAQQRVVVGDDSGAITCFEIKKGGTPETVFRLEASPQKISRLALGGNTGEKDKIFLSTGEKIKGISRKGKEFFTFDTNLTETIKGLFVENTHIWSTGEYSYNVFENAQEQHAYMCPDKINDMLCATITKEKSYDGVIGCQDRKIRVLQSDFPVMECAVDQPVTTLATYQSTEASDALFRSAPHSQVLLYGTQGGQVGQLFADTHRISRGWQDDNFGRFKYSGVTALASVDMMEDGIPQVVVGREDGMIQVYSLEEEREASLLYSRSLNESIRSLEAGTVSNSAYNEIVACTYGGRVVGITSEELDEPDEDDSYGRSKAVIHKEHQIMHLQQEVDELSDKLSKEKAKLTKAAGGRAGSTKDSSSLGTAASAPNEKQDNSDHETIAGIPLANVSRSGQLSDAGVIEAGLLAASQPLEVSSSYYLDTQLVAYRLTLELPVPIETVALRSSLPVDLVDVDRTEAVVSRSPPQPGSELLATYRCQGQTNRMELQYRTAEGQAGDIEVFIVASVKPKTAKSIKIPVKPLNLHHLVHPLDTGEHVPAMSTVRISGDFSLQQAHDWISSIAPDVSSRPTLVSVDSMEVAGPTMKEQGVGGEQCARLWLRNALLSTLMIIAYKQGVIVLQSESASAILIAKESINNRATQLGVRIDTKDSFNSDTVRSVFDKIHPMLSHTLSLSRKIELMDALKELEQSEDNLNYLSNEYKEILENGEKYRRQLKDRPRRLEVLIGVLTDLFVDANKLNGRDVSSTAPTHGNTDVHYRSFCSTRTRSQKKLTTYSEW
eukprot:gb/GECG01002876.1/.p1 GENE.gb/GECG01002876.1/~~gb/GECG01002876.1/.p1  ORF type:complete len:814 (+),score=106.42 gb/GECG01002876.1/:1-2442(+)